MILICFSVFIQSVLLLDTGFHYPAKLISGILYNYTMLVSFVFYYIYTLLYLLLLETLSQAINEQFYIK